MSAITFPNREEWLEWRNQPGRIGASDAAKILGLSDHGGPLDVYARWQGYRQPETLAQRRGQQMEGFILDEITTDTHRPKCLDVWEASGEVFVHSDHPWLAATLDARWTTPANAGIAQNVVVEAKDVRGFACREWGDGAPMKYVVQCQVQLACTGFDRAVLVGLLDHGLVYHEIERNQPDIDLIIARLIRFREIAMGNDTTVLQQFADDSARTAEMLRRLWAPVPRKSVVLADDLIRDVEQTRQARLSAEKAENAAKSRLAIAMGDAEVGESDGYSLLWKATKKGNRGPIVIRRKARADVWAEIGAAVESGDAPWV